MSVAQCASLGVKRNCCVQLTQSDIIAHWDDDDWSHEDRLQLQVRALMESGRAVTGFRQMLFWDERDLRVRIYSGSAQYVLGTSLCYRRTWAIENQFKSLNIGEDNDFVSRAAKSGQLHVTDGLGLMVATTHANGTSPRNYTTNWTMASKSDLPANFDPT